MKAWHVFLIIAAIFNAAQYVTTPSVVALWLFVPLVMFVGLSIWAARCRW